MKCKNLTYEVGKEYFISDKKMCKYGFHYCKNLEDTLRFAQYHKESIVIEIEDLDENSETRNRNTVSSNIKLLRVVPKEEMPESFVFDEEGNLIETKPWIRTYDKDGNILTHTFKDEYLKGYSWTITYKNGKFGKKIVNRGHFSETFYDEKGRAIRHEDSRGFTWERTYDEKDRQIRYEDSDGVVFLKEYDDENLIINTTNIHPNIHPKIDRKYTTKMHMDSRGNLVKCADSRGLISENTWDDNNNLVACKFVDSTKDEVIYEWEITIK